jgi:hypothetical protein
MQMPKGPRTHAMSPPWRGSKPLEHIPTAAGKNNQITFTADLVMVWVVLLGSRLEQ